MAPFSVSDLKDRASQVKSAGLKSYSSARDKLSSQSNASRTKPPLPPPRRTTQNHGNSNETTDVEKIDWANLSEDDKQAFFTWLDEFFARYLNLTIPAPRVTASSDSSGDQTARSPRNSPSLPPRGVGSRINQNVVPDPPNEVPASRRNLPPVLSQHGPPKINVSTKPSGPTILQEQPDPPPSRPGSGSVTRPSHSIESTDLQMSFPPSTVNGSAAADLASFMHPSTPWDTEWYAFNPPMPPYLKGSSDMRFAGSFGTSGGTKTARGVILFSDLSMCWYSVTFGNGGVTRWARFLPCPAPMSGAALQRAAKTHGAAVATFAKDAAASGRPVARGECWDIANEGLQYAASLYGPNNAPVLSTSRAHGHLLYCGKPGMGRWRGGDDRFRAGDIVEWREVRIGAARPGAFAILGNPDHTAVLVQDTVPRRVVGDGESVMPADVGVLTVVEQSAGHAPKRDSYDLAKLQKGEVWVYRPVSMVEYVGSALNIDIPPGLETYSV
ncbi:hypothetical protein BGW80DRAFT_1473937 [Lactifluus volemus]|nr:hypothetical protein BGW80DRAFT_1473937 [Lactifluus volemus]